MDTSDTAHQLDAEVVVAEVAHTMTNTQPSCPGGGKSNRILNTFKEAMDFPQAARLKEALDKDIASLDNHVVFGLVQIASVLAGHKVVSIRWVLKLRRTVPTRVDSSCKDFGRSLASTAVAATFPRAGSRVSAWCSQSRWSWTSRRTCCTCRWEIFNVDVEGDVFVKMAPDYETNDEAEVPLVMKPKKNLYGLWQSPKNWFRPMHVEVVGIGFRPLKWDPCIMYIYVDENGFAIVTL